jgi:hypothetical protein
MVQKFITVGDVYMLGGTARLKITISHDGLPVDGIHPTVTIVRDRDNYAVDFVLSEFAPTTPLIISGPNFRTGMNALGLGTYYYDFDPKDFDSSLEEVYTVIYKYDTSPNQFITESEFTMTNSLAGKLSTGFGLLPRYLNVLRNTPTKISYLAMPGQDDVKVSVYDPFGNLLIASATMRELDDTGVYSFLFTGRVDGDYVVIGSEETNGSKDAYLLTIGGDADRLKRIESLLLSANLKAPSVGPCDR